MHAYEKKIGKGSPKLDTGVGFGADLGPGSQPAGDRSHKSSGI